MPIDPVISESVELAKQSLRRTAAWQKNLLAELEIMRDENARLWEKVGSPDAAQRSKRDSVRIRRTSIRLSFRVKRSATPREKLQDMATTEKFRSELLQDVGDATVMKLWLKKADRSLNIITSRNGVRREISKVPDASEWEMLVFWAQHTDVTIVE